MKFSDLKIGLRLALLGFFFLLAMLMVGYQGWNAIKLIRESNVAGIERATTLTTAVDMGRSAQVEFKNQIQAWKNIMLRGGEPALLAKYTSGFQKSAAKVQEQLQELRVLVMRLQLNTDIVDQALRSHQEMTNTYLKVLKQYDPQRDDSANAVDSQVRSVDRAPTQQIDDIVAYIGEQSRKLNLLSKANSEATYRSASELMGVTLVCALVLGVAFMIWLVRGITKPLIQAIDIAKTVAAGDLRCSMEVRSKDEIGELLAALNQMSDNLAGIVGRVRQEADHIADTSAEISNGNLDLSKHTRQQSNALIETVSSMSELTGTVCHNSDSAHKATRLAETASQVVERGGVAVSEVVQTMQAINESSHKIADIIGVIDGIAFQTNILALNAAVEAARAGEQGRGFAVVASEVRTLAQRSAAAAKEIKELIGVSVQRVEAGTKLVDQAGQTMGEVKHSVQQVTAIVIEIAAATSEQRDGIQRANIAINEMDSITQQNARLVEQAAAAADTLQMRASELAKAASIFKVHGEHRTSHVSASYLPALATAEQRSATAS